MEKVAARKCHQFGDNRSRAWCGWIEFLVFLEVNNYRLAPVFCKMI